MKKRIWILSLMSVLLSVCFCLIWQWADTGSEEPSEAEQRSKSAGNSMGQTKEEQEKYYMCIDGDTICAYSLRESKKTLIKQTSLNHVILPPDELQMLKDGIYASSYEELCLFFESYTS